MAASTLGYIFRHPDRLAGALARDPFAVWDTFYDRFVQKREYRRPQFEAVADPDWESGLHAMLGAPAPCAIAAEFHPLWNDVVAEVAARGIAVGPESYAGYNDGDTALVRAIWCLVRHLRPAMVVETGVGHGFTSRFILEAMEANGRGHLYSIDRPPLDPETRAKVGIAVGGRHGERWTLIGNSSRRALPGLVRRLGTIDLFIHDSQHTERNVCFELGRVWPALKPGAIAVVDDIDSNWGYERFTREHPDAQRLVCEAEPVRRDERRFNGKGLFAILRKM